MDLMRLKQHYHPQQKV